MPPFPIMFVLVGRSEASSSSETLAFGMLGAILTMFTLIVGILQYRKRHSQDFIYELGVFGVEVYRFKLLAI